MPRRTLTTDDGIFSYRTSDRQTRYGVRLRIHGRLWQRQGFRTKTAAQRVRDKIRVERFEGIFFPEKYQRQRAAVLTIAEGSRKGVGSLNCSLIRQETTSTPLFRSHHDAPSKLARTPLSPEG